MSIIDDFMRIFKLKYTKKSGNKSSSNNNKSKEGLTRNTGRKIIFICL